MPTHVLVAADGSTQSERAIEFAADEWGDLPVTLLHLIDPAQAGYDAGVSPSGSETWYRSQKAGADVLLAENRERFLAERDDARGRSPADVDTRTEVGRRRPSSKSRTRPTPTTSSWGAIADTGSHGWHSGASPRPSSVPVTVVQ